MVIELPQLIIERLLVLQPLRQLALLLGKARHLEPAGSLRVGQRGQGPQHAPHVLALVQARSIKKVDILQRG